MPVCCQTKIGRHACQFWSIYHNI